MSQFDTRVKKMIETIFFLMPRYLTPIQTPRAIPKQEENWSLAAVAKELHCSKTCIFLLHERQ
jgi:hypothetical protein